MIFSPTPSWAPALLQPADWFVFKISVILLIISLIFLIAGVGLKGGDTNV